MRRTFALAALALLLLAGACAVGSDEPPQGQGSAAAGPLTIAILGNDRVDLVACQGCTGWLARFSRLVSERTGRKVEVKTLLPDDDSVPRALQEVGTNDAESVITDAAVVIVNIGSGNVLPDPESGIGCRGSLGDGSGAAIAAWIRTTRPTCLVEGVHTFGSLVDQVLTQLRQLRGEKPTVRLLINNMNPNIDPDDGQSLLAVLPAKDRAFARTWALAAYERWNSMLAERAAEAGFQYVDAWHALNGPDGNVPLGPFAVDGAHLSQSGNDVVAGLLDDVDLSELTSN
jgi:hypothetical protein